MRFATIVGESVVRLEPYIDSINKRQPEDNHKDLRGVAAIAQINDWRDAGRFSRGDGEGANGREALVNSSRFETRLWPKRKPQRRPRRQGVLDSAKGAYRPAVMRFRQRAAHSEPSIFTSLL